jgi:hypothetical protein
MSQDWSSDSDDGDKFDWESDGEAEPLSASALSNLDSSGPLLLVLTDDQCVFRHITFAITMVIM